MNKEILRKYANNNYSANAIAKIIHASKTTVIKYLNKYNIKWNKKPGYRIGNGIHQRKSKYEQFDWNKTYRALGEI